MKPIIKWAGGKTQLLPHIAPLIPKFNRYYEPFIGAGAVFFNLDLNGRHATLSDLNRPLIELYRNAQRDPLQLWLVLNSFTSSPITREVYYQYRDIYNREKPHTMAKSALFIVLNKTGFNGLYRENKKGGFNVPYGKRETVNTTYADIYNLSQKLKGADLFCVDFEAHRYDFKKDDFVYLDPPYDGTFTGYQKGGFTEGDQVRLRGMCDHIDQAGGKFLLSNANTPFIRAQYSRYSITEIETRRSINRDGNGRSGQKEVLIRNYE